MPDMLWEQGEKLAGKNARNLSALIAILKLCAADGSAWLAEETLIVML